MLVCVESVYQDKVKSLVGFCDLMEVRERQCSISATGHLCETQLSM